MKLLHTADWHLGKRLGLKERTDDHIQFLSWLLDTITNHEVDILVIAGDVFDTGNPSNTALKLYYDFLWQVTHTCCRSVVVIGGNHDSVGTLHAPKDLLLHLNVHVVGGALEQAEEQLIAIQGASGTVELMVCAIPFLRDRDVKLSVSGETMKEREERIRTGIEQHYQQFVPLITPYKHNGAAVVATGHLFAAGALATPDSEKDIHVGNLGQVSADMFPAVFDYVALGHLHRPQMVNGLEHIRYSGSPLALSFSENEDEKKVVLASFTDGKLQEVTELDVPSFRKMVRVKGTLEQVTVKLSQLSRNTSSQQSVWLEVQVETSTPIYDLEERIKLLLKDNPNIELLFVRQMRTNIQQGISEIIDDTTISLHDLSPSEVFAKKCMAEFQDQDCSELMSTFAEAMEAMGTMVNG